jgi:hypothetical protein
MDPRIDGFLAAYTPAIAATARACRRTLHGLFPQGYELVYDNYNALVFAFASTERASGAILSIAVYPRWVTLFFAHGVDLSDPHGLLEGDGARVRGIRLKTPQDLDQPAVRALIAQARAPYATALAIAGPLQTLVKAVSTKQRPRRPL